MNDHLPIFVVVDGIIGAGKTTLIRNCLVPILTGKGWRVTEIREPVEKWKNSGRLEQFYADPRRRAFQFQIRAFHDRVRECQEKYRQYKDTTDIFLLERSIFTDVLFVNALLETNAIDRTEYEDYLDLWTMWQEVMPFRPDLFIYLKPSIPVCMGRLQERARNGEAGVDAEYQSRLQEKHDEFLGGDYVTINDCHYVPRILLETNSNFRDDLGVQQEMCNNLECAFKKIQSSRS